MMMLKPLMEKYHGFIVTEDTGYAFDTGIKTYRLKQVNRRERLFIPRMLGNCLRSLRIYLKEKPDAIICTGVLATIPLCMICKMAGKNLIYIESFAKVTTPTETGKFLYKFADRFYVQWPEMLQVFPRAIYIGSIY